MRIQDWESKADRKEWQIFDMTTLSIIAGPKGLKKGDELTFFYPSTVRLPIPKTIRNILNRNNRNGTWTNPLPASAPRPPAAASSPELKKCLPLNSRECG
jgi:hypothetical protein